CRWLGFAVEFLTLTTTRPGHGWPPDPPSPSATTAPARRSWSAGWGGHTRPYLSFAALRGGPPHLRTNRTSANQLRTHRPRSVGLPPSQDRPATTGQELLGAPNPAWNDGWATEAPIGF